MDCGDSDCSYDQFCGGASTGSGGVDCKKFTAQGPCRGNVSASGLNCTWVNMSAGGMIGQSYCDFPGSDCWMYETDISLCQKSLRGCIFRNATGGYPLGPGGVSIPFKAFSGFCDINKTKSSTCYNSTNRINATLCNATSDCVWIADNYMVAGGRCEFMPYAICGSAFNSSDCNSGTTLMGITRANKCAWRNNSMSSSGGFCEPTCAGKNSTACTGFCAWKSTTCEPEAFGGMETGGSGAGGVGGGFGCHINDGNQTSCLLQNMSCSWNSFSQNSSTGICMPKGEY